MTQKDSAAANAAALSGAVGADKPRLQQPWDSAEQRHEQGDIIHALGIQIGADLAPRGILLTNGTRVEGAGIAQWSLLRPRLRAPERGPSSGPAPARLSPTTRGLDRVRGPLVGERLVASGNCSQRPTRSDSVDALAVKLTLAQKKRDYFFTQQGHSDVLKPLEQLGLFREELVLRKDPVLL